MKQTIYTVLSVLSILLIGIVGGTLLYIMIPFISSLQCHSIIKVLLNTLFVFGLILIEYFISHVLLSIIKKNF